MLFSVFEKFLFDFYVPKNQNILTFQNIRIRECAKSPAPNQGGKRCGAAVKTLIFIMMLADYELIVMMVK